MKKIYLLPFGLGIIALSLLLILIFVPGKHESALFPNLTNQQSK